MNDIMFKSPTIACARICNELERLEGIASLFQMLSYRNASPDTDITTDQMADRQCEAFRFLAYSLMDVAGGIGEAHDVLASLHEGDAQ
jgi:hypothetical protein